MFMFVFCNMDAAHVLKFKSPVPALAPVTQQVLIEYLVRHPPSPVLA